MASVPGSEMVLGVEREGATVPDAGRSASLRVVGSDVDVDVEEEQRPLDGPSDLDEARDTGRTGDVVFVSVDAQRAFSRAAEEGSIAARLAEMQIEDEGAAVGGRAWLLRRALPVAALLVVIALSVYKVMQMDSRGAAPKLSATVGGSTGDVEVAPAPPDAVFESAELPQLPDRGVYVRSLLEHQVERVRPDASPLFIGLNQGVIEAQRVTVLNLWATWCPPCKSELPDLKNMFDRAGWGDKVRFVSILSRDTTRPATAHKSFAGKMPSDEFFMAEIDSSDKTLAEALHKRGLIAGEELPITIVLDCRRTVRFAHQGRLSAKNFEELGGQIDLMVADLGGEYCDDKRRKRQRRPIAAPPEFLMTGAEGSGRDQDEEEGAAAAPEPEAPSGPTRGGGGRAASPSAGWCGDKRCLIDENCRTCPGDCACPEDSSCQLGTGGYACVHDVNKLKED